MRTIIFHTPLIIEVVVIVLVFVHNFTSVKDGTFPQAFSYEKDGDIYLIVPVSHAAGDYALVKYSPETK